jgi:pyruvate dehydrogenase E2 component (dihydrolipoamide acetyltransferase)
VGGVYHDESESTASLIDVDGPHVQTVEPEFLEQDVQTTTQAERMEREAEEKEKRKREEEEQKKAKTYKAKKSSGICDNTSNPVFLANAAIATVIGAGLGFGAYKQHAQGNLSWELVGLSAGAVGVFGAVDYFVSK